MGQLRGAAASFVAVLLTAAALCAPALADNASPVSGAHSRTAQKASARAKYTYSEFIGDIAAGRVATAEFITASGRVTVKLRDGSSYGLGYPLGAEQSLADKLTAAGANVSFDNSGLSGRSGFDPTPFIALGIVFSLALGLLLLRRLGILRPGNGTGAMRQHAKQEKQAATKVRFCDIAGCDEAVEEVSEMVEFLKSPERFHQLGARMPGGVILFGPPGTGKTLLAKAVANEAGVDFFATSGSDFMEMFVGLGAKRIRELFARARKSEGAVIFIDEVDAVGGKRGVGVDGGHREADQTLNALLTEMDGFNGRERIVVIAATNRLDTLDPALLRPGRFSRHVPVTVPDETGRLAILQVHSRDKPLAADADLERIAHITSGSSGAELAEMLNEAAIWTARQDRQEISNEDLWEGLCRVVAGPKKQSNMLAEGERDVVAYHEAGHVIAGELCPSQDKTQHATIEPRGQALGFALKGRRDRGLQNEQHLHEQLIFILGGRAAEYVVYGTVSSGAANDLQQSNLLAREAVEKWGLSPRVGQLISEHGLSEQMRAVVDEEVRRLVADAYRDAVALVREHEPQLRRIAQSLLAAGSIDRPEIELSMQGTVAVPRMPQVSHSPDLREAVAHDSQPGRIVDGRELFGRRRAGRLAGLRAAFSRAVR
ncbi:MAG TPA: AAA family ATPase [Solirubrobacteraceae bacterium]|nr:AAA family ATPase [Solirubrobacteraceae bacterium]